MNSRESNEYSLAAVKELAHQMINSWTEDRQIEMRPDDKIALIKILLQTVPKFLEISNPDAFQSHIASVRREERQFCVDVLCNMQEPFPGVLNKQRAINGCTYPPDPVAVKPTLADQDHDIVEE